MSRLNDHRKVSYIPSHQEKFFRNFQIPKYPIIMNVSAKETIDINQIKSNLINQLDSPVRWVETINQMVKLNCENFIEIGPNKVLKGLNNKINNKLKTTNIENSIQIEEI